MELGIKRLLVVDDEQNIVNAVQRELNSAPHIHFRYEVECYTSPESALERAGQQSFDAVISDYRMPGMNGLEFLKAFARIQPECPRIVLSGQTDMSALVRMVNESHIYHFIPKPWNDYQLKVSISQALDYAGTLIENRRLANLVRHSDFFTLPIPEREVDQILIVDDDLSVLNSLARALTTHSASDELVAFSSSAIPGTSPGPGAVLHEDLIKVHVSSSPAQAVKLAEGIQFSCILADDKMAEMNGIDLLQHFLTLQPDCARILVSGGISTQELARAVDSARIFAFVDKPWTDFELKSQVALALSRRHMLLENRKLAEVVRGS